VLEELEMTNHLETRVDKLSGGQRKRASVALELLTGVAADLDEPTSGLDPALDRQVMTMLRQLADAETCVLVVTHSLTSWTFATRCCAGPRRHDARSAGHPARSGRRMGTRTRPHIFSSVAGDRMRPRRQYLAHTGPPPPAPPAEKPASWVIHRKRVYSGSFSPSPGARSG